MTTPTSIIDESGLSTFQIIAIAIAVGLNGLDGLDIVSISFAAPGIAADWGINKAELGVVLSAEVIGMAVGSIFLGGLTDKIGRRPLMLGCLCAMTLGMALVALSTSVMELLAWRFITGIGIGGMLAAVTAATAEYSNRKNRSLAVSIMAIGYPLGAVFGGLCAAWLLESHDWRSIFVFGACATAAFIPLVWFRMPETVAFLSQKQPSGALEKINATLRRMGQATADALPLPQEERSRGTIRELFGSVLLVATLITSLAYFAHAATFYFILKWVPKIVVDMGIDPSSAARVLVWLSVGGALGGALIGVLARRYPVKHLTIGVLVLSFFAVWLFGRSQGGYTGLVLMAAMGGFFTNAAIVGLYSIAAQVFPTQTRASGAGFMIGFGRGGSALSPIIAGIMFENGVALQSVALLMGCGSLIAAIMLMFLKVKEWASEAAVA